jgi:hypothetical protein
MGVGDGDRERLQGAPHRRYGLSVEGTFIPLLIYIIGALVFFRQQVVSGFDLGFGGRGDARMAAFIHEHVYRWLHVRAGLLSPPFFFDQTGTLGYTDAFLLNQLFYAPLRAII